ncbi:MAG: MFS transporter, partial [Campylobacteraceae bacterium]|nr:MFS transporter [Campylobacteraceae bacterium]
MLLFLHSFLSGISLVFFETAANTLFLMEYSISELPYVYIIASILSVLMGVLYTKLQDKIDIQKLLKISLYFVLCMIIVFFILIKFNDNKLSFMGIMIFKDILWMFVGMEFGILSGIIFNIRQGKRLFGLLMTGEILSGILGGLSIGYILNYIQTIDLLFFSSLTLILSIILLNKIIKTFPKRFDDAQVDDESETSDGGYSSLLKNKYYLIFFSISLLSFLVFYFIDYIFYFTVEARFTDEKELAIFFGIFIAMLNVVNIISSVFLSGKLLSRYGVGLGLMAIPVLALIGTSSLLVTLSFSVAIAFVILLLLKLLNEAFDISILTPSFRIMYQSIPISQRMRVIAFRETIIEPIAMGLAGVLLLFASAVEGIEMVCYAIIIICIIWVVLAKTLKVQYVEALKKLLNRRQVITDETFLENVDSTIFLEGLKSDNEVEVIFSLESLAKIKYFDIKNILESLLSHDREQVRLSVLNVIYNSDMMTLSSKLQRRIQKEKVEVVFSALLNTYCKLLGFEAIAVVKPLVGDKHQYIKESAIVSLVRYCGIDGILIAGELIKKLFADNCVTNRLNALGILNRIGILGFYDSIKESLESQNDELKNKAIETIGNLKVKRLVPEVIKNLNNQQFRINSINTLVKFGSSIVEQLIQSFESTNTLAQQTALIKVLASLKDDIANDFILKHTQNTLLVDVVYEALFKNSFRFSKKEDINDLLFSNLREVLKLYKVLESFNKKEYINTFDVINEFKNKKIENIFLILGLAFPRGTIIQARSNYQSKSREKRAFTVELLDNLLSNEIKNSVIPILEDLSLSKRIT